MITPNHGFSGLVCAHVAMPLLRRYAPVPERATGWAFFLGAVMPDLDIASKALGRAAYFSGDWYAHRGASHSLLGTLILAAIAAAVFLRPLAGPARRRGAGAYLWLTGCFWAGAVIHIFGDLFTPGMAMPVFWPLAERFGGLSHIGWFSPYLLWLFLSTLLIGWLLSALGNWNTEVGRWRGIAQWLLFATAGVRWVQFLTVSRYDSYSQWAEYQRSLLPEAMIRPVTQGVSELWFWLTG
jgi:membrane-bound metal-dependent hydrolase YbcI (DUF457 family)